MSRREDYERDLKRRQAEHLSNIGESSWKPCMHDSCPECVGTGVRKDGRACVHGISCSCPKCSPKALAMTAANLTDERIAELRAWLAHLDAMSIPYIIGLSGGDNSPWFRANEMLTLLDTYEAHARLLREIAAAPRASQHEHTYSATLYRVDHGGSWPDTKREYRLLRCDDDRG